MMDVASSANVYSKGSLLSYDKDWCHGKLTRAQAEEALKASGSDCFLIREDGKALVLSLIHHGHVHHVNIKYGPGWYELESGSAQYSINELDELVSFYSSNPISNKLKFTLGVACKKTGMPHHYEAIKTSDVYSKGQPVDLMKYDWYHGSISEEQAEGVLARSPNNAFLVRDSHKNLMLSKRINGWPSHDIIHRSPLGYHLEGKEEMFKSVPEMIAHYQQFPIRHSHHILGGAVDKHVSGAQTKPPLLPSSVFKKSSNQMNINWKRCADSPVSNSIPPVVKIGDDVYVGSGLRLREEGFAILKYSIINDSWSSLPDSQTYHHGLTVWDGELVVVGGVKLSSGGIASNVLYTFRDNVLKEILPPMPTPRYSISSLSYKDMLILAAGGQTSRSSKGEVSVTDIVEIYKRDSNCWCSTLRLPFPLIQFSTHLVGDTLYTLGGTSGNYSDVCTTLYTSVSSLLESAVPADGKHATPQIQTTWKKLRGVHPLTFCAPVELNERLVAMGGSVDQDNRQGSKFISTYDFATDTWMECSDNELPLSLYRPGLVSLGNNKFMLIGGQTQRKRFSKAVFIGSYTVL